MALAQLLQFLQPVQAGYIQAALALHTFDDDGGRQINAAARIDDQFIEHRNRVDVHAEVTGVRRAMYIVQRHTGGIAEFTITGQGQRTQRYAVEAIGKRNHHLTAGDITRQLDRGFDGIGAGRAGELDLVLHLARQQHMALKGLQERFLGAGRHIEAVHDTVFRQVIDDRLLHDRIVVTVIQRAGTGQEVDIAATAFIDEHCVLRFGKYGWE
ncbi:hypothetical protein D3C81_1546080 [compost metagenome]